mgnify:CR=1 FL=1
MNIAEIQAYYDKRMAELLELGVAIPNDLERIGVLLDSLKKHD